MTLNPQEISPEAVRSRLAAALELERGDDSHKSFIIDICMALGTGDEKSALNWCKAANEMSLHKFLALCRHFGPDFANRVFEPLTGLHVTLQPSDSAERLNRLQTALDAALDHSKNGGSE